MQRGKFTFCQWGYLSAIYIRKTLESDTLHLPELKPLTGKTVEIVVREEETPSAQQTENPYDTFFALAGQNVVDPEAYKRLRDVRIW